MVDYPQWRYSATNPATVVQSATERDALPAGFASTPFTEGSSPLTPLPIAQTRVLLAPVSPTAAPVQVRTDAETRADTPRWTPSS